MKQFALSMLFLILEVNVKFCFAQFIETLRSLYIEDSRKRYIMYHIDDTLDDFVSTLAFLFFIKKSVHIERWKYDVDDDIHIYYRWRNPQTDRYLIWQTYYDYLWNDTYFVGDNAERNFLNALCEKREREVNEREYVSIKDCKFRKYYYVRDIIQDFMKDFAHILAKPGDFDEVFKLIDRYRAERCFKDDQEWIEELNEFEPFGENAIV